MAKNNVNKPTTPNIKKSLGYSFLCILVFALLYAFFYSAGPFAFVMLICQIVLSLLLFFRYVRPCWRSIFIGFVWTLLWSVSLNICAIFLVESFIICEMKYNLFTALTIYIQNLFNDTITLSSFQSRIIELVVLGFITCFILILIYANSKKIKITHTHNNQIVNTDESTYFNLYLSIKHITENYKEKKDKNQFSADIKIFKEKYINTLNETSRETIINRVNSELSNPDTAMADKQVLKCLQKILNEK